LLLKSIEIFGFKSFPKKTRISLDSGITALVGPNGCGKSNIVDAIRWALGEQRPNMLRCDRMHDIIFGGTETRRSLGLAEVTLTFANDGRLSLDFEEVEVTRRLYRSGESEYFLNRAPCRHKDVVDLFLNTGLSSKAYSTITIEMVDRILKEDPEVRRNFFEEAAGIAKYRATRGQALRKLEATEDDLLRLNDIILEVERTCRSLKRQAGRARRYQRLKQELRELESAFLLTKFNQLRQARQELKGQKAELEKARNSKMEDLALREQAFRKKKEELRDKETEYTQVLSRLEKTREEITGIERELARFRERKKSLKENLDRLTKDRSEIEDRIPSALDQVKAARTEIVRLEKTIEDVQVGLRERNETLKREEQELSSLLLRRESLTEELSDTQTEENDKRKTFFALEAQEKVQDARLEALEAESSGVQNLLWLQSWQLSEGIDHVNGFTQSLKAWEKKLDQVRRRVEDARKARNALLERESELRQRVLTAKSELDLLKVLEERREGHKESARALLAKENSDGHISTVADRIEVPEEYIAAVEGALEAGLSTLILEREEEVTEALDFLKKHKKGRAAFAALPMLKASPAPDITSDERVLGRASDFVRCEERDRSVVNSLLDRFLLCKDLKTAIQIYKSGTYPQFCLLTVAGDSIDPSGIIRGGSRSDQPVIGRRRRIETLEKNVIALEKFRSNVEHELLKKEVRIQKLQAEFSSLDDSYQDEIRRRVDVESFVSTTRYSLKNSEERLARVEQEKREAKRELERVLGRKKQVDEEVSGLAESRESVRLELSALGNELNAKRQNVRDLSSKAESERMELYRLRVQYESLKSDLSREEKSIETLRKLLSTRVQEREDISAELLSISALLEEKEKESRSILADKTALHSEMSGLEQKRNAQQKKIEESEQEVESISLEIKAHQEKIQDLRIRLMEVETKGENLKDRASEELGLDLEELKQLEDTDVDEKRLEEVRANIAFLEPVNMLAFQEYEEANQRLEHLLAQRHDLTEAKESLRKALRKIDRTARDRFIAAFEEIRVKFKEVFGQVFDGGEADILLAGDTDPLRAEIQIFASPKGKRMKKIELLSSGEKTLVSISLLFAIFLVKPSPFCVLDEIDAPLDDSNIRRFVRLLERVSNRSQIALITHNKTTMESANFLYGITMEEPGVTKVVSVRLKEEDRTKPIPELVSPN
jgi:chromosome segregation protein